MTCDSVFISNVGNGSLTWWDGSRLTQDQHTCFWPLSLNDIRKVVLIAADLISALSVQSLPFETILDIHGMLYTCLVC